MCTQPEYLTLNLFLQIKRSVSIIIFVPTLPKKYMYSIIGVNDDIVYVYT